MMSNARHRRRRAALLAALASTAFLVLQMLLVPQQPWESTAVVEHAAGDGEPGHAASEEEEEEEEAALSSILEEEEIEMADRFHRILLGEEGDNDEDADVLAIPGEEPAAIANPPVDVAVVPHSRLIDSGEPFPPYTIQDAIESSFMYDHTFALLVYDPDEDAFMGMISRRHYWVSGVDKLMGSFKHAAFFLRKLFPERFQGRRSKELVIPISSGDYPGVRTACLDYFRKEAANPRTPVGWQNLLEAEKKCGYVNAPILHFGSAFRQPRLFPSMIAMPMPEPHHLQCMETWVQHGIVCNHMRATGSTKGLLPFGEELGIEWEDLIPQVVWRGTDFSYLTKVHPKLQKPVYKEELIKWPFLSQSKEDKLTNTIGGGLTAKIADQRQRRLERVRKRAPRKGLKHERQLAHFTKAAAVQAMRDQYDTLLPRWKAVVLTAEAEVQTEAEELGLVPRSNPDSVAADLPWANMKFASYVSGGLKTRTQGSTPYKEWEDLGFPATGEYLDLRSLARYKYHIDLGGGGGTTWAGTVEKLGMPGLLFHHMTPTKDYVHEVMRPWVHFIPVSSDLRDLKRKYEWAESHPEESRKIARQGTELMRHLTSPEGYDELFVRSLVEPLRKAVEAYRPISKRDHTTSYRNYKEAFRQIEGDDVMLPVIRCGGWAVRDCKQSYGRTWMRKVLTHRMARHV